MSLSRFFSSQIFILVMGGISVGGCASRPGAPLPNATELQRAPANDAAEKSILRQPLPNAEAFLGWKPGKFDPANKIDPFTLPEKLLACEQSDELFPTHPQMNLKQYYQSRLGNYDASKLKSGDEACKIDGKAKNNKGIYQCIAADTLNYVMISDTYRDFCGNLYRGFSEALYFSRNDNMGTLLSKGRVVEPRTGSSLAGDMVVGSTYSVPLTDFVMLTDLLPGDEEQIKQSRAQAAKDGFEFDAGSLIWKRKTP